MSMKSRLFASVAAPVLSLPLLMQPAYALPSGIDLGAAQPVAAAIIRVQEQVPAEGEEIPKRRKPQTDEGEGAERPRGERQQRAEQPEGERPQRRQQADQGEGGERPQRRQQQDAGQAEEQPRQREQRAEQPEGERPQRRQQQADQGEGSERPQRRQQNAEQAPEPRQQAKPDAEQAEQPKPRKERQQQAEQPQPEQPQGERPQRQQADQGKEVAPPKSRAQQNADQAPEPAAKPDAQQAEQPTPRPQRQQQAEQPQPEQPQGRPQQAERPQGERPQRQQADQGEGGERPQRRPQQNADQAPVPAQPDQQPGQTPRQQAQEPNRAPPERAASGGERNQPRPVEQPMLPVENGAAVLDSAKEQRPDRAQNNGDLPRRDGNRPDARTPDRQQAQERPAPPPRTDADAQASDRVTREDRERWRNQRRELVEERGERMDGRPDFERPRGWDVLGPIAGALLGQGQAQGQDRNRDRDRRNWDRDDGREIISIDNQTYVRHNDSRRFYEDGRQPEYERLGDGRYREIVERDDGTRVVTIRNRYGEVVQRSRVVRGGKEYVLYYAPELLEDRRDYTWRDPGDDLPPMRLGVPIDDYIIDTSSEPDRDYYRFLEQPPVERVERPYSLDEVRYSARIRDKVPRIDLDTITFATGSAEIPMNQASSLRKVADAINQVLEKDPSETFLIEGHTDAVGSDESNLVLSDRRAESVAVVLSDAFGIPPENMTTQGYGERYLKVSTEAANQENRRVTIRRITPLVKPVASNQ